MKIKLLIFLLMHISAVSFADSKEQSYCKAIFGNESGLTYEPIESNRGVSITHSMFKEPEIKRDEKAPKPTGFRCAIFDIKKDLAKCPDGMYFDKKRNKRKICLSKKLSLKELCPTELVNDWPDVAKEICKKEK